MLQTKSNYFPRNFYEISQPQDMLEAGELLNAQGQPLNIGALSRDQRNTAGKALVTELVRLVPEFRHEFTTMANNKFTNGDYGVFNDQQRKDSLESIAATVKLLQGLKEGRHGMQQLSQAEFDQVKTKLIPYANFACADGTVTKLQEMLYALKTSRSGGMEGILYNAKVAHLDQFNNDVLNLRNPGIEWNVNGERVHQQLFTTLGLHDGNAYEIHDLGYMKRLVSREFNIPKSGDADHYITNMERRFGERSRKSAHLSYLVERFEEKQTAINVVDKLVDDLIGIKPLIPSENQLGDNYQQPVVSDFSDSITNLKDKMGYKGELFREIIKVDFPEGTTQEQIENIEVLPTKFSYKASADAIFRLAAISGAVEQGYLDGDLKVFTCPSMKDLILDMGERGIEIKRDFVALDDILRSVKARIPDMDNTHKIGFYFKLSNLRLEIESLDLKAEKKEELLNNINADQLILKEAIHGVDIDQLNQQRETLVKLFEGHNPETIARLLTGHLNRQEPVVANDVPNAPEVPQINAAALKMFCPPEVITKMEEVAKIMTKREENKYSFLGDLLDILVNTLNKFIGRGLNDSMLQENITKMQEISTAYNQLGLPVQEQAQNLSFVEKLSRARANQQDVGGNAPIMV